MVNTEKVTFSVYIDKDIKDHMDNNPMIKSPSVWISKNYREEFMSVKIEELKLDKLKEEMEKCLLRITMLKEKERGNENNISKEAMTWLKKEGMKNVKKYPLKNVLAYFNKEFHYKMKKKQFKKIVNSLGGDSK